MTRVLVAMSGGVDSSVAAALLIEEGHDVVGVTLKLWGGASDSGCCSVADVEDARRVAQQLGIDHWVLNFADEFESAVVTPYAEAHAAGRTPNPCIECNRDFKFGRLLERARRLGFDAVATGHHARVERAPSGRYRLLRGADGAKDQSYVLHMLGQGELSRCRFPVGEIAKSEVRRKASDLGLRTADKPESQDVCFITASAGRKAFLAPRIPLRAGTVVDRDGVTLGRVDAVELVTVGQRRGLGAGGGGDKRYAIAVDTSTATVTAGSLDELMTRRVALGEISWVGAPLDAPAGVEAQCSAHGAPVPARFDGRDVEFREPHRRVAPGQSVVLYRGDEVIGGGPAV
ncbi:MAG: tRNA 2-thiouridine(34) synthase MnmA [Actinomycetota bacterium]|nr:tRNA 2-thiouridine(34) synthase MnmA [Actinomycetota bacterium]